MGVRRERVERGQRNKQGRVEKEANQLYRRHQITGQATDEEEGRVRRNRQNNFNAARVKCLGPSTYNSVGLHIVGT